MAARDIVQDDVCRRAAVSRRCFCQNYGEIVQTAQLVPRTELEVASILQECIEFLQVSPDELDDYARYNFQLNERSRCLMRCVIIRQGLYDDVRGPDLDRMYVQCGGYDVPEDEFKESARKCIDRLTEEFRCDKCALASRIVAECFPQESGPLFATIVAANLLKFKIRKTVKLFKKKF
uniref:General odorant-binding protein 45 n=1 Tax=Culex pipiens TaxID=7175 RepID=A0A8D8JPY2_CULPI